MPTNVWPQTDTFSDGVAEGLVSFGSEFNSTIGLALASNVIRRGHYCVFEKVGTESEFTFDRVFANVQDSLFAGVSDSVGVLHRRPYSGDVKVEATFCLRSLTGTTDSSHFRRAGVCARVQGGTLVNDATTNVAHQDSSFYWARLEQTADWPATTYRFQILRVVAGVETVVVETEELTSSAISGNFTKDFSISLEVAANGSDVDLTATLVGVTFESVASSVVSPGPGSLIPGGLKMRRLGSGAGAVASIAGGTFSQTQTLDAKATKLDPSTPLFTISATDSSGSKLTGAGRVAVTSQRDIGFGVVGYSALQSKEVSVVEPPATAPSFREVWKREFLQADYDGFIAVRNYQGFQFFYKDGAAERRPEGRLTVSGVSTPQFGSGGAGFAMFSDAFSADLEEFDLGLKLPNSRTHRVRFTVSPTLSAVGSSLATILYNRGVPGSYTLRVPFSGAGSLILLERQNPTTSATEIIASFTATIPTASSSVLEFEATTDPAPGAEAPVRLRAWLNSTQIAFTTGLVTGGITILPDGTVVDASTSKAGFGGSFAHQTLFTASEPATSNFELTTEQIVESEAVDPDSIDPDNLTAYAWPGECDGQTGTLALEYEFLLGREAAVRRDDVRFENGSPGRHLGGIAPRRTYRVRHLSMDEALAQDWIDFWEAHRNEIPFTWTPLEDGFAGCFRFVGDELPVERTGPVYSLNVTIEELRG